MHRLAVITLLLFLPLTAGGAVRELRFDRLGIEDGLSQSSVTAMLVDSRGWLWVGTEDGLNRHDGYEFKVYRHDPKDPTSLGMGYVLSIIEDSAGTLWVGTEGGGLNRLDRERGRFERFRRDPKDPGSLVDDRVQAILEDSRGRLWVGTHGGISRLDAESGRFTNYSTANSKPRGLASDDIWALLEDRTGTIWIGSENGLYRYVEPDNRFLRYAHDPHDPGSLGSNAVIDIFEDSSGRIWIATFRGTVGLNRWDPEGQRFIRYAEDPNDSYSIPSNHVNTIVEDPSSPGTLWLGTRTAGLVRFDIEEGRFTSYSHDPSRPSSISNNRVSTIVFDHTDTLWAGTYDAGLNRLHRRYDQWVHYAHDPSDPESLPDGYVRSIAEDESGTLWIGTYDGGLARLGPGRKRFTVYQHDPYDPTSLSHNEVRNVYVDRTGTVWAATYYGGLNRLDSSEGSFTHFMQDPTDPTSLSDNRVMAVQEDGQGTLWVGTENGLNRFDRATETFHRYRHDRTEAGSLGGNRIYALYSDRQGQLWVATLGSGLDRYDRALDSFVHYRHDPSDPLSLPNDTVLAVTEDSRGRLWVGTLGGGLALLDRKLGAVTSIITTDDGLPNNVIYGIVEDDEGGLWLSTNDGLARFDPETGTVRTYTVGDGLLSNEFSAKAYARTRRGELAFGSILGLTLFTPEVLADNPVPPPVVITELKLFGEPVGPGPESLLGASIENTRELVLSHRDDVVSFEFAALDFVAPQKNRYAYRLEGFDESWRQVDSSHRFATYTNLDPGHYTFRVRASNSDGIWNEDGATIEVRVSPPPWRTWWAYGLYALVVVALFSVERRRALNRIRLEGKLELERLETEKLKEVDQLKSKFFANISHEFRTPLSLLLGPIEELIQQSDNPEESARLRLMQRNAQRLHRLVDQLLDLSRLEGGSLALQSQPGDLVDFLRGLTMAFESLAKRQKIALDLRSDREFLHVQFDAERVEAMVVNLISNAFKFTPDGGRIEVTLASDTDPQPADTDSVEVTLTVRDTGIGIPDEFQSRVFERFYQVDSSETREQEGAGIGLALVRELAELHQGEVGLESQSGQGSEFRLRLRFERASTEAVASSPETIATRLALVNGENGEIETESEPDRTDRGREDETIVLLVEDNADLRAFIRDRFDSSFRLIEADNGVEGLEMAIEVVPDLVISDIMMPRMDGYTLCRRLKSDERTSHIPVVLLTAKADRDEKLEGLELGADAYLTKPFDSEELLVRSRNLIEQRRLLRQRFSGTVVLRPSELELESLDRVFLEKALAIIEERMDDEELSVETLAKELFLSRSQLHRKLKALTNQTPTIFIRNTRLERAAQLLNANSASIGEIAYQVGFSSQAYFTKCFRDHFGCTPSEFARQRPLEAADAT